MAWPTVKVRAFHADAVGPIEVRAVPLEPNDAGHPREALVLRDEGGALRAYLNVCRHLPIPIDGGSRDYLSADGGSLMCGTHGALYRRSDGLCTEGPCEGASLVPVPFEVDADGWVLVERRVADPDDFED